MQQLEEAGLAAGSRTSALTVIDYARQPVKPVSPNLPVYMAITLFISSWIGLGIVFLRESFRSKDLQTAVIALAALFSTAIHGQPPPAPNLSGLPMGVFRIPQSTEKKSTPNARNAPAVWDNAAGPAFEGVPPGTVARSGIPMAAPLGPGDLLEVTESHTPDLRGSVRVSEAGNVTLALAGEVHVGVWMSKMQRAPSKRP